MDWDRLREERRPEGTRPLPPVKSYIPEKYRLLDLETGDVWEVRDETWRRSEDRFVPTES